jgi:general secretion pathway protein L
MRWVNGVVLQRGNAWATIPVSPAEETVILVIPGTEVSLHWVDLPSASGAQAQAAGRLLAAEVSATPLDHLHVAVGDPDAEGMRCLALMGSERLHALMDHAQAHGFDPDMIVPEPFLLSLPDEGATRLPGAETDLIRGSAQAFAADPGLTAFLIEGQTRTIDASTFEAELGSALNALPVDLRQGSFARRRRWKIEWPLIRRLGMMAAVFLGLIVVVQLVLIARYNLAASRLDLETAEIAQSALPKGVSLVNAPAQLSERLGQLRGGGRGFSSTAASLFSAVQAVPEAQVQAITFTPQGLLRATIGAPNAPAIMSVAQRVQSSGFSVDTGPIRAAGGQQLADISVGAAE